MKLLRVALLLLVSTSTASAQDFEAADRILLPVAVANKDPLPGANGSLWTTELSITNQSATSVFALEAWVTDCRILCAPGMYVWAGTTIVPPAIAKSHLNPGAFLHIEAGRGDDVGVHLRVHDVSRQAETWGTSVPVVRENDLFSDRIDLIDIPSSGNFRSMLRVYDFDEGTAPRAVRIRVSSYQGEGVIGPALFDQEFTFLRIGDVPPYPEPGFIQLPLPHFENLTANDRLRIEITPLSPGLRFWAFVSVTHNVTQHLTVITPAD